MKITAWQWMRLITGRDLPNIPSIDRLFDSNSLIPAPDNYRIYDITPTVGDILVWPKHIEGISGLYGNCGLVLSNPENGWDKESLKCIVLLYDAREPRMEWFYIKDARVFR